MRVDAIAFATVLALGLAPAPAPAATEQNRASTAILFQSFHWNSWRVAGGFYVQLESRAADLADLGVTHVWLPPPSEAASDEGYLPRRLDVLDSRYGTEGQLRSAVAAPLPRDLERRRRGREPPRRHHRLG